MAMKIHNTSADAMLAGIAARCNNGYLRIYSGTESTNANTALGAQVVLAELQFPATAFPTGATTTGTTRVLTAGTMVSDSGANATGTASFFRVFTSAATTAETAATNVVYQGTVTATSGGGQLELSATNIVQDGVVSISALTIVMPTE